jgi:hypothetical protein
MYRNIQLESICWTNESWITLAAWAMGNGLPGGNNDIQQEGAGQPLPTRQRPLLDLLEQQVYIVSNDLFPALMGGLWAI